MQGINKNVAVKELEKEIKLLHKRLETIIEGP